MMTVDQPRRVRMAAEMGMKRIPTVMNFVEMDSVIARCGPGTPLGFGANAISGESTPEPGASVPPGAPAPPAADPVEFGSGIPVGDDGGEPPPEEPPPVEPPPEEPPPEEPPPEEPPASPS
jgi:hypothetical protein